MVFTPSNKTRVWVCKKCHWSESAGKSDALLSYYDVCPKCGAEVELTLKNDLIVLITEKLRKLW